ncbi:MAG: hypothetical protein VYC17_01185 [Nitrospinota bacterium]|nr:hypothetical protein [Nitrospinota bacterium]
MWKNFFSACLFLGFGLVVAVPEATSNSGHSKPSTEVQTTAEPTEDFMNAGGLYAVDEEETESPSSPFSRSELLISIDPEEGGVEKESEKHGEMNHTQHQVRLAHYELISPSQKGYTVAVGVTVLVGAIFGVLGIRGKKN